MRPLIFTFTCTSDETHTSSLMLDGDTVSSGSWTDQCPRGAESRRIAIGGLAVCTHCGAPLRMTVADAFPVVRHADPYRKIEVGSAFPIPD